MARPLLTLALLALSLPAPALSFPLQDQPLAERRWSIAGSGDAQLESADPFWWRYRTGGADRGDRTGRADIGYRGGYRDGDGYGDGYAPGPGWRQHRADGLPVRPDNRYGDGRYGDGYGYRAVPGGGVARPGRPWPLAVLPPADPALRRCGPGAALVGAAIGGGLGAALSDGSRQRQWALPIGATVGGLLGGVLAGC